MRAVLQRVDGAEVTVDGGTVGRVDGEGLLVLLGVTHDDGPEQVATIARKICELRILEGERSVLDAGAQVLIVSQFTLYGDARKGRRPSWSKAAPGPVAEPIVEEGQADVIIAFERLEALRYAHFLKKDGALVVNDWRIDPMPVVAGNAVYPEGLIEKLQEKEAKIVAVDALSLAEQAGSSKAVNVVLIGVMAKHMELSKEEWLKTIEATVPQKFIEMNKKAFELGYER